MSDAPDWEKIAAADGNALRSDNAKKASDFMSEFKGWSKSEQMTTVILMILIVDPANGAKLLADVMSSKRE